MCSNGVAFCQRCMMRKTALSASAKNWIDNAATLNATKVGEPLNMSSRAVNTTLEQLGFQYRDENKDWKLTEAGTAYGEMKPYHRNGHSGYEVRWKPSVVDVLRNSLKNDKEAA